PLQPEAPRAAPPKPSRWVPRGRMIPLLGAGSVVFALGVYCAWSYNSLRSVPAETVPQDVTDRYNPTMARNFDSDNERTEYWQGILKLRKRLAQEASGHVLEVSAGTGRNTEFYDLKKCRSLTLVDQSASMLEEARKKWQEWRESRPPFNRPREEAMRLVNADALKEIPPAPPSAGVKKEEGEPDYYDTVVQTMGLCSTPEPEKLLEKMGDAVKDDGRILLLEHGKAKYNWLNSLLDKTAAGHADRYGCWWNKDIDGIVRRAKGLEVVEIKRKHFGTTWWVELRK
ncbi:S-adenosyl-L-methionine-dependent methyltransferase, partial [Saccharata proteae CBS 121410]